MNVGFNKLRDLSGIDNLSGLSTLEIYHNSIESLAGVDALQNLKELHLEFNNLLDTSLIQRLKSLKVVTGLGNEKPGTGALQK